MKGICILGSTGSIGQNTLRVVRSLSDRFRIVALAAGRNIDLLAEQVRQFSPRIVSVGVPECADQLRQKLGSIPVKIVAGPEGHIEAATHPEVDFVVSSAHGVTGVQATYEAICAGKRIGLANKETLVVAGELVTQAARERGIDILPIDSEHSALHQCLRAGERREVQRLILTASGGPFLRKPLAELKNVAPDEALKHPIWKMGSRITIDSATMMNKGLEIIEAQWLFGLPQHQITVLIHPQSIIHSMVEFQDGAVVAQLSVADMRLPIQYALTYPDRVEMQGNELRLDLATAGNLHFEKPEPERFPCLELARAALESGGAMPCALNAADEIAVEAYLARQLPYWGIPQVIERVLSRTRGERFVTLQDVLAGDREARERAKEEVRRLAA